MTVRLQRSSGLKLRDHIGVEVAALAIVVVASAVWAAWREAMAGEEELNARTRARLSPSGRSSDGEVTP